MKIHPNQFGFSRSALAVFILTAYGAAHAEDNSDVTQLINPDTAWLSIGASAATGDARDRSLWGQYNGLRKNDFYPLIDFEYIRRDDATGTWTNADGRNLGLDDREVRFSQERQGDWKYSLEYNEIVKHDPRTINTFVSGAGTTTPTVNKLGTPGTGTDLNLKLKRQRTSLGFGKWFSPSLQFEASFKNEDKDGSRLFGRGFACSTSWRNAGVCTGTADWALLMLPEPIDSNTRQFEAKLNYITEKFALTVGYYGSFFSNHNSVLDPVIAATAVAGNQLSYFNGGTAITDTGLLTYLGTPMALPPDNQAHQIYLDGNYSFTPTTHGAFKLSYARATQDDTFPGVFTPVGPGVSSNLDGRIDTTFAQAALTSHPIPKLTLRANLRYEDKNDKTPVNVYNLEWDNATLSNFTYTNNPMSSKRLFGKLEGTYLLPYNLMGTLGIDYEEIERSLPVSTTEVAGLNTLRNKTDETSIRAELRRNLSETLNGSISYINSRRAGSDWYQVSTGLVVPESSLPTTTVFLSSLGNRERDKVRLTMDWNPADRLSLQFVADYGEDHYTSGSFTDIRGLRNTDMSFLSLDMTYVLSEAWKIIGYASYGDQTISINHSTGYRLNLNDRTDTAGLSLNGKVSPKLNMGADLSYTNDRNRYHQLQVLATSLPDVLYRETTLKLFGNYALDKKSNIRVDLVHSRIKLDEFTWNCTTCSPVTPFTYSDGTTVTLQPEQNVSMLAVRYIYKFQ